MCGLVDRPHRFPRAGSTHPEMRYLRGGERAELHECVVSITAARTARTQRQNGKTLAQKQMTVTVYTTGPQCQKCNATKRHLKRRGIPFTEVIVNPDDPNDANYAALAYVGYSSAPVVLVSGPGGEQDWSDYRAERIDALVVTA